MGRRRKDGDPLGLAGTRLALSRNRFYYIHRDTGRWEDVGTDVAAAKRAAERYNNPGDTFGRMAWWFAEFLRDAKARVAARNLGQRTFDDYTGYAATSGPLTAAVGHLWPEQVTPQVVQAYLAANARLVPPRPVAANKERAFLSAVFSWLLREGKVPGLQVNPCMRASGVRRNPEKKRERYVTHEEYRAVFDAGNRAVRLAMELVYRTLQRPEVDVLAWTPANVRHKGGVKVLSFRQSKTGQAIDIALVGRLGELVAGAIGTVPQLHQPIVHTLKGTAYTYSGPERDAQAGPGKGARRAQTHRRPAGHHAQLRPARPQGQGRHRHVAGRRAHRPDPAAVRPRRSAHHRDLHQGALARDGDAQPGGRVRPAGASNIQQCKPALTWREAGAKTGFQLGGAPPEIKHWCGLPADCTLRLLIRRSLVRAQVGEPIKSSTCGGFALQQRPANWTFMRCRPISSGQRLMISTRPSMLVTSTVSGARRLARKLKV